MGERAPRTHLRPPARTTDLRPSRPSPRNQPSSRTTCGHPQTLRRARRRRGSGGPTPLGWVDGHRRPYRDRAGTTGGRAPAAYVAAIQRKLAEAGQGRATGMHAMGTSLEGSTEDILAVVGELHSVPFELGLPRVYTVLKLDERRDRPDQTLNNEVPAFHSAAWLAHSPLPAEGGAGTLPAALGGSWARKLSPGRDVGPQAVAREGMGPRRLSPGKGRGPASCRPGKGPAPLATARAGCGRGERGGCAGGEGPGREREEGATGGARIRQRRDAGVRRIRDGGRTRHGDAGNSGLPPVLSNSDGRAVDLWSPIGAQRSTAPLRPLDPGPKRASEGREV